MKCEGFLNLWGRADSEWMPFITSQCGNFNEHPIAGAEIEPMGPLNNQVGHFGRKNNPRFDHSFSVTEPGMYQSVDSLDGKNDPESKKPFDPFWRVYEKNAPIKKVKHVKQKSNTNQIHRRIGRTLAS